MADASEISHPYVRISDPSQRKGGGIERQTSANLAGFCERFGFQLSKHIWIDDGVSAFHGLNATPDHELGKFLAEARRGLIRPGDCLLIENYDRLSRQNPWAAIGLVNDLRQLGIHVGRLDRMKLLRCDSTDTGDFFEAAIEFIRGHSESAAKSMRNGAAWERKRQEAREEGKPMTHRLPAWIELHEGQMRLIPARVAALEHIFALAASGYGYVAILRRLNQENVPPFGEAVVRPGRKRGAFAGRWTLPYLHRLLNDRRVIGEHQPCGRGRKPVGSPIPNYFPPAISEEEFFAAKAARGPATKKASRQGKHTNLFAGLLRNARDGGNYLAATKSTRVLVAYGSQEGRSPAWSFPLAIFEEGVLSSLIEIDPHEILNGGSGPDETIVLRGQHEQLAQDLDAMKIFMAGKPFSATIGEQILALESRLRETADKLRSAQHKAKYPASESWGEMQALGKIVRNARQNGDTEKLLRLRAVLRRIINEIWMLVVPRGRDRLAAVQVRFAGSERRRDYLICHRAAGNHRPPSCHTCSLNDAAALGELDLRRPADAAKLEKLLGAVDLPTLTAAMRELPGLRPGGAKS